MHVMPDKSFQQCRRLSTASLLPAWICDKSSCQQNLKKSTWSAWKESLCSAAWGSAGRVTPSIACTGFMAAAVAFFWLGSFAGLGGFLLGVKIRLVLCSSLALPSSVHKVLNGLQGSATRLKIRRHKLPLGKHDLQLHH